jgi:alpha-galactosidase
MVNPKSELYENHPDWVIRQPERTEKYFRNQLVLDLANPEVQDFVFGVVDTLFTENPKLSFIKWDCNAPHIQCVFRLPGSGGDSPVASLHRLCEGTLQGAGQGAGEIPPGPHDALFGRRGPRRL